MRTAWLAIDAQTRITIENGREMLLLVQARAGDTWESLAQRYAVEGTSAADLSIANPGRAEIRSGAWYRLPVQVLAPTWRSKGLLALFPKDELTAKGWVHSPSACPLDTYGEGAWQAALWFTGDGENFREILKANGLSDPILPPDRQILIPRDLLLDSILAAGGAAASPAADRVATRPVRPGEDREQPESEQAPENGSTAVPEQTVSLSFDKDAEGGFASYRLQPGEALYSAVVIRFTGRLDPDDVADAASVIARRSGIRDVTSIPAGFTVKIPLDMLLPEFLPEGNRKRKAVDAVLREASKVKNPVRSKNLAGIHLVLDAGHGGIDPGALVDGIAEHEYVYDVMCRVKRILETETAALVHPTIEDPGQGFAPRDVRALPANGGEEILTSPAHVNGETGETSLGVNLRWYLANSIERRLAKSGVDPSRILFASFHADVLHPSVRGTMVYVPGERYRRGAQTSGNPGASRYAEVREMRTVSFSRQERIESEGLSRQFASLFVRSLAKRGLGVHPYQPIRDRIIRGGREWVPAVLRGNAIPVKVLVEILNLNNSADRALLQNPKFRESFARAFVDAVLRYYKAGNPAKPRVAQAQRQGSPPRSKQDSAEAR